MNQDLATPLTPSRQSTLQQATAALRLWGRRQIMTAIIATIGLAILIGAGTVMFPNPIFARSVETVWWNYPVWLLASVLSGMLVATYVRDKRETEESDPATELNEKRTSRLGMAGGVLAWFAVGCPVCNKIVLLALGSAGAMAWFAPVQPFMGLIAIALSAVALIWRLKGQIACPAPVRQG